MTLTSPEEKELLLSELLSQHATQRLQKARQLAAAGEDAQEHLQLLADSIGTSRSAAAMLEWMGEAGSIALASKLGGDDSLAQRAAMEALLAMNSIGASALDIGLGSDDPVARRNAAEMLCQTDSGTVHLVKRLKDPRVDVRLCAVWGLSLARHLSRADALELGRLLQDEEAQVQDFATQALMGLGEVGADALAQQLAHRQSQELAAEALISLEAVGAMAAIAMLRSDQEPAVRRHAAAVLQKLGEDGAAALASCLQDEDAGLRRRAAEALGRMGELAVPHLQALTALLKDKDSYVRVSAERALRSEGLEAAASVPA